MINIRNKDYIKQLGRRVSDLRTQRSWSQEHLANCADIPISQVGRLERGEINPTVSTIYAIATAMDMTMKEVFEF